MSDPAVSTDLAIIELVGPPLANDDAAFAWTARLQVVDPGERPDKSLVNSTMGMRVMLQAPVRDCGPDQGTFQGPPPGDGWPQAVRVDLRMRTPHLLSAIVFPKLPEAKLYVEGGGLVADGYPLYPSEIDQDQGSNELIVVPLTPWPMPQLSNDLNQGRKDIKVPRFRLAEGRLKVLLNARDARFLTPVVDGNAKVVHAFVPEGVDENNIAKYPHLDIATALVPQGAAEKDKFFIAIDLTPDGIEIEGSIADPDGGATIRILVRLVRRPNSLDTSKSQWSLELARDSNDGRLRNHLQKLHRIFADAAGRVFDLDLDTARDILPIRWPLDIVGKGLAFATKVDGKAVDWQFEIDGVGARARLLGSSVEGGELPTVVMVSPDRVRVSMRDNTTTVQVDADRRTRDPARTQASSAHIVGPNVGISWVAPDKGSARHVSGEQPPKPKSNVAVEVIGNDKEMVPWYMDERDLAGGLIARYSAAGVHPQNATTTYGFMPLKQGWLQWPFAAHYSGDLAARAAPVDQADPVAFDGSLEYEIPGADPRNTPAGRRVTVLASDYVAATAEIDANKKMQSQALTLRGASGEASGLLWFATASPSPSEILPHLRGGPVALTSPWLTFSRDKSPAQGLRCLQSKGFKFGSSYTMTFPADGALAQATVWIRSDEIPVVTAIAMSRTADSSPDPLSTRDLVPRTLGMEKGSKQIVKLAFTIDNGIPVLTVGEAGNEQADRLDLAEKVWSDVPLVPVTLPGIEFKTADKPLLDLETRLRHDLPILDELFARAKLPEKAPVSTEGQIAIDAPRVQTPTTLEPEALREAWARARDQLKLSYTQSSSAVGWGSWNKRSVEVTGLLEPARWTTDFEVKSTATIEDKSYVFGQYSFGTTSYWGSKALAGLTARFKLDRDSLTRDDQLKDRPVQVVGFATAFWNASKDDRAPEWRDMRGTTSECLPQINGLAGGYQFILRQTKVLGSQGATTPATRWRATATKPIEIKAPSASEGRRLALWFRDLPLSRATDTLIEFTANEGSPELARGPQQSAFDPCCLPFGSYEWRFCNDPVDETEPQAQAEYEVAVGPFRFRPLRLLEVRLSRPNNASDFLPEKVTLVGLLLPPGTSASSTAGGPFGIDRAYANGNLVKVDLVKDNATWSRCVLPDQDTGLAKASFDVGPLVFRLSQLAVSLDGADEHNSPGATTGRLELMLDESSRIDGHPNFKTASLEVILFGNKTRFSQGTVSYGQDELVVEFSSGTSGVRDETRVRIDGATLRWHNGKNQQPQQELQLRGGLIISMVEAPKDGNISQSADDPRPLVELQFPAAPPTEQPRVKLRWCNLLIGEDFPVSVKIDHARGLIEIGAKTSKAMDLQPVAGLKMTQATVEAHLVVAIRQQPGHIEKEGVLLGVSGFGSLLVANKGDGVRRFHHKLVSAAERETTPPAVWLSEIEIDFILSRESRIHWPISSLPDSLRDSDNKEQAIDGLAQRATGRRLKGQIGKYEESKALRHCVTLSLTGARVPTTLLESRADNGGVVALATPWHIHALARHELISGDGSTKSLSWSTVDHIGLFDAKGLVESSWRDCNWPRNDAGALAAERDFAFVARPSEIKEDGTYGRQYSTSDRGGAAIRNGLVLRPVAHAGFPTYPMALYLAEGTVGSQGKDKGKAIAGAFADDGIVMVGAAPLLVRVDGAEATAADPLAVVLSLPWIITMGEDYDFGIQSKKLAAFRQAKQDEEIEWDAPDIDWAAGSLMHVSRLAGQAIGLRTARADEIRATLVRAMYDAKRADAAEVRTLMHVEQAFPGTGRQVDLPDRPLWLRSLVALRVIWKKLDATPELMQARVTSVMPSGNADGRFARIAFSIADNAFDNTGDGAKNSDSPDAISKSLPPALFVAIGTSATVVKPLPALEAKAIVGADASIATPRLGMVARSEAEPDVAMLRSRLVARAHSLVPGALTGIVLSNPGGSDQRWITVEIPADLDDPKLSIPLTNPLNQRLFASPALGWPTRHGTEKGAATGALGMGDDRPFQDAGPHGDPGKLDPDSVTRYGSGLSGRSASLSLAARASAVRDANKKEDSWADAPVFFALGRKVIFDRPESNELPLVCPPAQHLSPSLACIVTPVAQELNAALSLVVRGPAAPIVPPYLERTTFGLRPGVMQAEFDALIFTQGTADPLADNMDSELARFGRPGHAGPVLVRQVRPPRAPGLPRLPVSKASESGETFVESHGRRTYVCVDYLDAANRFPKPFRLFDGIATVLRRSCIDESKKSKSTRSYHIRVQDLPLRPYWNGDLSLAITSPSAPNLPRDLAELGLLRAPDAKQKNAGGVSASLSIGRTAWPFSKASYDITGNTVKLTFNFNTNSSALSEVNAALDMVDGDTAVTLMIRCGREDSQATLPASNFLLIGETHEKKQDATGKKGDGNVQEVNALDPETRRTIVLPLTVQPRGKATMPIGISTLVFADPSYDRELSGPGAMDPQRDAAGNAWKLAIDRIEYGTDTPVYFAFGKIKAGKANGADKPDGAFDKQFVPTDAKLSLARNPAPGRDGLAKALEPLSIAGLKGNAIEEGTLGGIRIEYAIQAAEAFGITFDRLRNASNGPVSFDDGDQLVLTVTFTTNGKTVTLSTRAAVVPRPVIAPPPAVYSLVIASEVEGKPRARVALHATGPLPQKIEFPNLLDDLALGHIRRQALFEWRMAKTPDLTIDKATLIKVDRAGGGQFPDSVADMISED